MISHAGSLLNLAKHPASTVQILGAEKALFKALKTKHDTPKYGIIYHAQVVGQASAPLKGKINFLSKAHTKGQLISKCPFGVTLSTKIATKLLSGFFPYYVRLNNRAEILTIIT